jgi:hypothetical protein
MIHRLAVIIVLLSFSIPSLAQLASHPPLQESRAGMSSMGAAPLHDSTAITPYGSRTKMASRATPRRALWLSTTSVAGSAR